MEGNPVNPAHVNDGTVLENHAVAGTVPVLGNHVDEVTLIPRNHVDEETIHIRTGMLTEVRTLSKSNGPTMLLWMP